MTGEDRTSIGYDPLWGTEHKFDLRVEELCEICGGNGCTRGYKERVLGKAVHYHQYRVDNFTFKLDRA